MSSPQTADLDDWIVPGDEPARPAAAATDDWIVPEPMTFTGAMARGVDQAQGMGYGTLEAVGEAAGIDTFKRVGKEGRERNEQEAAQYGERSKAADIRSIGDFGQWAKETAGERVPMMAGPMAGGIAGAAGGFMLGGPIGATIGGVLGAFVPSLILGTGEVQSKIKEKDPNAEAPGYAFAGGSAIAALDSIIPGRIGSTLVKRFGLEAAEQIAGRTLLRRVATEAPKDMVIEGVTEAVQEAIGEVAAAYGADKPIDWKALPGEMFEAGAAGGLMGFGAGGVRGASAGRGRRQPQPGAQPSTEMGDVTPPGAPPGAVPADTILPAEAEAPVLPVHAGLTRAVATAPAPGTSPVEQLLAGSAPDDGVSTPVGSPTAPGQPASPALIEIATGKGASPIEQLLQGPNAEASTGGVTGAVTQPADAVSLFPSSNEAAKTNTVEQSGIVDPQVVAAPTGDGTRASPIKVETADDVTRAGAVVNTEPTDGQKKAGNYSKAHIKLAGLDVTIENPKGSVRSGISPEGTAWSVQLPADYGYVKRTTGKDGDQVDVYVGPQPQSPRAYVVDQFDPKTGKLDEHKIMLGFASAADAIATYDAAFSDGSGPSRRRAVSDVSVDEFKAWLKDGDTKKPFGPERSAPVDLKPAPRTKAPASILEFIARNGGISPNDPLIADVRSILGKPNRLIPGVGMLVRPTGKFLDNHREAAAEAGYFQSTGTNDEAMAGTTVADLLTLMAEHGRGRGGFAHDDEISVRDREQQQANRADNERLEIARAEVVDLTREHGINLTDDEIDRAAKLAIIEGHDAIDAIMEIVERSHFAAVEEAVSYESQEQHDGADEPAAAGHSSTERPQAVEQPGPAGEAAPGAAANEQQPDEAGQPGKEPQGEAAEGVDAEPGRPGGAEGARAEGAEAVKPKPVIHDKGPHYAAGFNAKQAGEPRELPSYFKSAGHPNAKAWFKGWDEGNAPAASDTGPVTVQQAETVKGVPLPARPRTPSVPTKIAEQTETTPEAGPLSNLPALDLANDLLARLSSGKPITAKIIQAMATEIYGAKLAEGKFDRKDMQDALELAVNLHVKAEIDLRVGAVPRWQRSIQLLDKLLDSLPTQHVRSEEQESFQQFSTPPNYAYAAVFAANIKDGDTMLEPSAGTGSIVAAASNPGVKIIANELSERRVALLRRLVGTGGQVFNENAEQIDNILDVKPSVVVMNPPFSQTAGRMGDKKVPMVAAEHIEAALNLLAPGGRLVAIVGRGMTMGAPAYRAWFSKIAKSNTLIANIGVGGKAYEKYGTTFGTRLLVIDKVAPSGKSPILEDVQTVEDLMRALEPIREQRPDVRRTELDADQSDGARAPAGSEGGRAGAPSVPVEPGVVGPGERGGGRVAGDGTPSAASPGGRPVRVETAERDGVAPVEPERPGARGAGEQPAQRDEADAGAKAGGGARTERDLQPPAKREPGAAAGSERVELETGAAPGTPRNIEPRPIYADDRDVAKVFPALRAALDKIGLKNTALRLVDNIELWSAGTWSRGSKVGQADGMYLNNLITVALGTGRAASILHHEALHALRRNGVFTEGEWSILSNASNARWRKQFEIDTRYAEFTEATKTEEGIAHAYAAWTEGETVGDGRIARLFKRIRDVLEAIGNAFRGHGFKTAESIFADISSGKLADRTANPIGANGKPLFSTEAGADGRPQEVIPGAEKITERERVQRKAAEPLKPKKAQKDTDGLPLFGDKQGSLFSLAAWHGSPHQFKRFMLDKIGTGEGAQVYGWGLYFAGKKDVAEYYKKSTSHSDFIRKARELYDEFDAPDDAAAALSESADFSPSQRRLLAALEKDDWLGFDYPHQAVSAALREPGSFDLSPETVDALAKLGNLYKVNVNTEIEHMLDWDKPLSEQSEYVKKALASHKSEMFDTWRKNGAWENVHGKTLYQQMARDLGGERMLGPANMQYGPVPYTDDKAASLALKDAGIPGLKYLDEGSRALTPTWQQKNPEFKPAPTHNYVVFDETLVEIEAMFSLAQEPVTAADRQRVMQGFLARGQFLDRAVRVPFDWFGGLTRDGQWKPGIHLHEKAAKIIVSAQFKPNGAFAFINPFLEGARVNLIDRYSLRDMPEYVARERERALDERAVMMQGAEVLQSLKAHSVGPAEAKVLQAILTGEDVNDRDMQALAEPIRAAVDQLGQEAVGMGLLSAESFERNRGTYLHRVYKKYEADSNDLVRTVNAIMGSRRKKIIGDQFRGRGIFQEVVLSRLMRDVPDWHEGARGKPENGEKFIRLDEMPSQAQLELDENLSAEKPLRTVYWPADRAIPDQYAGFTNQGIFEVRGEKAGKIVIWRDFTKAERTQMGEILDARYTIGKTFMLMAHDLSVGKFYKDIAENEAWARSHQPNAEWVDAEEWRASHQRVSLIKREIDWVKAPETEIANSGGKKRYGALAGKWVREEIWRDLNELEIMNRPGTWRTLLTWWKLNKTARSPIVHMNNVMSNFVLMDLMDVRFQDLIRGIKAFKNKDANYQEAFENGAFGADMMTQEVRDQVLKPILEEIARTGLPGGPLGTMGQVSKFTELLWSKLKALDQKMIDVYRVEDELFRMATYLRRREFGDTPKEAANVAREQFIDYDIRAPWVNAARNSVLPFISYTYRAVPLVAKAVATRPWKIAKYAALAYAANALAYALTGGDEDKERRSLREQEQGRTWIGAPRMLRLPWNDKEGNPVFLDIRRWMPAGDVFDFNQGQMALPIIPAWLNIGGPLMLAAEFFLNKQAFTGKEITNDKTDNFFDKTGKVGDWAWKSLIPNAPWVPGSWSNQKLEDATQGVREKYTDRPINPSQAAAAAIGIKIKPEDVDRNFNRKSHEFDKIARELATEKGNIEQDFNRGALSESAYERAKAALEKKRERNSAKAIETLR